MKGVCDSRLKAVAALDANRPQTMATPCAASRCGKNPHVFRTQSFIQRS